SDCLCRYRVHRTSMSADRATMDAAAEGVYAELFRANAGEAARALRRQQARLEDLEYGAAQLEATVKELDAGICAVQRDREAALRDQQLQYQAALAAERTQHEAERDRMRDDHAARIVDLQAECCRRVQQLGAAALEARLRHVVAEGRFSNRPFAVWG